MVYLLRRSDDRDNLPSLKSVQVIRSAVRLRTSGCFSALMVARILSLGTWFIVRCHWWSRALRNVDGVAVGVCRVLGRKTVHGFKVPTVVGDPAVYFGVLGSTGTSELYGSNLRLL